MGKALDWLQFSTYKSKIRPSRKLLEGLQLCLLRVIQSREQLCHQQISMLCNGLKLGNLKYRYNTIVGICMSLGDNRREYLLSWMWLFLNGQQMIGVLENSVRFLWPLILNIAFYGFSHHPTLKAALMSNRTKTVDLERRKLFLIFFLILNSGCTVLCSLRKTNCSHGRILWDSMNRVSFSFIIFLFYWGK